MDPLLADLIASISRTPRPVDAAQVTAAWEFAAAAHAGQTRLSGDPYITHPTAVAKTLALWNLDTITVVAGLLHDTLEDGAVTRPQLVTKFGEEVALIVDGVTKITDIRLTGSTKSEFVENLRKMLLVMARDLRVILVKPADRLLPGLDLLITQPFLEFGDGLGKIFQEKDGCARLHGGAILDQSVARVVGEVVVHGR